MEGPRGCCEALLCILMELWLIKLFSEVLLQPFRLAQIQSHNIQTFAALESVQIKQMFGPG
jgi:hypothetical protein